MRKYQTYLFSYLDSDVKTPLYFRRKDSDLEIRILKRIDALEICSERVQQNCEGVLFYIKDSEGNETYEIAPSYTYSIPMMSYKTSKWDYGCFRDLKKASSFLVDILRKWNKKHLLIKKREMLMFLKTEMQHAENLIGKIVTEFDYPFDINIDFDSEKILAYRTHHSNPSRRNISHKEEVCGHKGLFRISDVLIKKDGNLRFNQNLELVKPVNPPICLYHTTEKANLPEIRKHGLSPFVDTRAVAKRKKIEEELEPSETYDMELDYAYISPIEKTRDEFEELTEREKAVYFVKKKENILGSDDPELITLKVPAEFIQCPLFEYDYDISIELFELIYESYKGSSMSYEDFEEKKYALAEKLAKSERRLTNKKFYDISEVVCTCKIPPQYIFTLDEKGIGSCVPKDVLHHSDALGLQNNNPHTKEEEVWWGLWKNEVSKPLSHDGDGYYYLGRILENITNKYTKHYPNTIFKI